MITIAVAKGYLLSESIQLLTRLGFDFGENPLDSRKLFCVDKTKALKLLQIRPWDVTEYVEQGAADLGIVGKDVLVEKRSHVLQLADMKFGHCRLVLAGPTKSKISHNMRVATKYPNATEKYFHDRGIKVNLIKLYGAIELAPLTGLADIISDLTATGKTLKEHKLHIIDTIVSSTAHLIANPTSLRFHYGAVTDLVARIQR